MHNQLHIIALISGIALMFVAPPSSVGAVIDIGDSTRLTARGSGVVVFVAITCDDAEPVHLGGVTVQLSQTRNKRTAQGAGEFNSANSLTCDSTTPNSLNVLVSSTGGSFHEGLAATSVIAFVCPDDIARSCYSASASEVITLTQ